MRSLLLAVLLVASAGRVVAQHAPVDSTLRVTPHKTLGDRLGFAIQRTGESFKSDRAPWREYLVSVRMNASAIAADRAPRQAYERIARQRTVISFEAGRAERFGQTQGFGGFDFYRSVTGMAFVNLRLRFAPHAQVIPEFDVLADITTGLAGGWEASGGYRLMRYDESSVGIFGVAAGRYRGAWYLRTRFSLIPVAGSVGTAVVISARRYAGVRGDFAELIVTSGREVVTGVGDVVLDVRQSVTVQLRAQYALGRHIGLEIATSHTRDANLTRWGLRGGLTTKF